MTEDVKRELTDTGVGITAMITADHISRSMQDDLEWLEKLHADIAVIPEMEKAFTGIKDYYDKALDSLCAYREEYAGEMIHMNEAELTAHLLDLVIKTTEVKDSGVIDVEEVPMEAEGEE